MLSKLSIADLSDLLFSGKLDEDGIEALKDDPRKGARQLFERYERHQTEQAQLKEKHTQMQSFERALYQSGCQYIAGIDEAGRGPLAGPVVAAAVILPQNNALIGLDDSKLLNAEKRNIFAAKIKKEAISYGLSIVNNQVIDQINIYQATKNAMFHAIRKLRISPDHVLIDAVELNGLSCPSSSLIKGDARSISIAAASVLAKVTRDAIMADLHKETPGYDFLTNKGYPTKQHLEALRKHGVSVFHRRSFAPVKNSIS